MYICHFCETSVEGAYFRHMATGLTQRGHSVFLIELGEHKPPTWLTNCPTVRYHALGATKRVHYPQAAYRLARFLKRENIDILQSHLFNAGLISAAVKRFASKTRFVFTRHHTSVVRLLGSRAHVWLDKWMAEQADNVVTVSNAARNYMINVDGINANIEVVYLGFDFETFAPNEILRKKVREEFGFKENDVVIGYVGNLVPGKGHAQLIAAYERILRKVPQARLFIVGGGRLKEVDSAVGRAGLGRRVVFAGWRNDTAACLNAMDIFVQPSLSEAFSQVLIEAMGVGLPVIATNVGGAGEVIIDGVNGFLIKADDRDEIAEVIINLAEDLGGRAQIARVGRAFVREKFPANVMVERQLHLYKNWMGVN